MAPTAIPIVHLGQAPGVQALVEAIPEVRWLTVSLWCPRDQAQARLVARGSNDMPARLVAWDETVPLLRADMHLDTSEVTVADAAAKIHQQFGLM